MKNSPLTDSDGYLLLNDEFNSHGFDYHKIKDLNDSWKIFAQCKNNRPISYELVNIKKVEEYEMAGNKIPKRWSYPGNSDWGKRAFTCISIDQCEEKFAELTNTDIPVEKEIKPKKIKKPLNIDIPIGKEFTIKQLAEESDVSYANIYAYVKFLGNKVKTVREVKNLRGKPTKILMYEK